MSRFQHLGAAICNTIWFSSVNKILKPIHDSYFKWASRYFNSPASRLQVCSALQAGIKGNIKGRITDPLWWESTGDAENVFML